MPVNIAINGHVTKIGERIQVLIGAQQHIAAVATITAVRSAKGDVFFAPETETTTAAITGFDLDCHLVNKFHQPLPATCPQR